VHVFALVVAELLKVGDIELNRAGMSVLRRGQTIHIGPTDYRLLEFFMQAPGRVFSRGQLLDGVWGNDVYMDERTVDVHIGRLRKALVRSWSTDPIRTVRGAGYSFEAA
jgi:two-component system phosphate regulon response regulator PhoB